MNDSSSECRIKYDRIKLLRRFALYFINSNTKLLGFVILIITILVLDSCSKNVLSFIPSPDGFRVFTWFSYYNVVPDEKTKLTQDNLIAEEIFYYKTRKKDTPGLEYSANYPVAVIRLPNLDDFTYVSIRMELISPQGRASLTFERLFF